MLLSAKYQHKSAIDRHMSLPSWTSLPSSSPTHPLSLLQSLSEFLSSVDFKMHPGNRFLILKTETNKQKNPDSFSQLGSRPLVLVPSILTPQPPPLSPQGLAGTTVESESVSHSVVSDLCNAMVYSPPDSSVQARTLEWVAIPFCRGSSWLRDRNLASYIAGGFFNVEPPGKPPLFACKTKTWPTGSGLSPAPG